MHSLVTYIAAAALLWHTLVGCCAHAHAGSCACHRATVSRIELGKHGHASPDGAAEHAAGHGCGHSHADAAEVADHHGDHESPHHPCRCHCEGNRCLAVTPGAAWEIAAPQCAFDVLPPQAFDFGMEAAASRRHNGGHWSPLALALPLRAHLYFQILLI